MPASAAMAILIAIIGLGGCGSDRRASPESGSSHAHRTSGTASASHETPSGGGEIMDEDQTFRRHYDNHYADSGYAYNQYRPAYRYGFDLAADPRFLSLDWNAAERIAWRGWDSGKMGEWDRYKDAVRYGWEVRRNYKE